MNDTKQAIKVGLVSVLYYSGALNACKSLRLRNKALVLMYHRVLPDAAQVLYPVQPGMYVTEETFIKHIRFLKKKFNIISISQLLDRMKKGEKIGNTCCITFDDGWRDNFLYAFPVLKQYSIPATIFLTTGFVGTDKFFWPDELSYYLQWVEDKSYFVQLPEDIKKLLQKCGIDSYENIHDFIDEVIGEMKLFSPGRRQGIINILKDNCKPIVGQKQLVSWEEVREMRESGLVDFGAHTVNHVLLNQLTPSQAMVEVSDSINHLKREVVGSKSIFAYPNGNYTNEILTLLKDTGVEAAVTTRRGYVTHDTDLLQIPRFGLHDDVSSSPAQLLFRILIR